MRTHVRRQSHRIQPEGSPRGHLTLGHVDRGLRLCRQPVQLFVQVRGPRRQARPGRRAECGGAVEHRSTLCRHSVNPSPVTALALVVEDGADGDEFIQRAVEAEGFCVRAKRSPQAAINTLLHNDPLLAVVDWEVGEYRHMSDMLSVLAARHPATIVIVVSRGLGSESVRGAISTAHPGALAHDRQAEPDTLRLRIRGTMGRAFGDLLVDKGLTVHIPCGRPFRHPAAAQLVAARGRRVRVRRQTAAAAAVWRFQNFLSTHGSTVTVAHENSGFRHLVDRGSLSGRASYPCVQP